ncbi:MAG: MFS transporter [Nitrososphaeria archaeon]
MQKDSESQKSGDLRSIKTDLTARLDRIPWYSWHSYIFAILFAGVILEGFSISLGGATLGALERQFNLTVFEAVVLTPLYLVGALIGAFSLGTLADYIGRRKVFIMTVIIVIIGSVIVALAFNYGSLVFGRIITAIGAEGEVAVANTALAEFVPSTKRGLVVTSGNATAFDVGTIAASLVAFFAIALLPSTIGWRIAFASAVILAAVVFVARLKLPESVRFLIRKNRLKEAEAIVSEAEKRYEMTTHKKLPPVSAIELNFVSQKLSAKYSYLFKRYPKRITLATILNFTEVWPYYAAFSVIPVILVKFFKYSSSSVSLSLIYITFAGVLGIIVMSLALDRIGRRKTITASYGIAAFLFLFIGLIVAYINLVVFIVLLTVLYFWVYAAAGVLYPQISEMFPTEIRSTAVGTAIGIGRLGGIIGPIVLGIILAAGETLEAITIAFVITAIIMFIGAIAEVILGPELTGKSLEEASAEIKGSKL